MDSQASIADFDKLDIRAGTIVAARPFPEAKKPAYQLEVDFGPGLGVLRSSAQITVHYQPEDLIGRQVLGVVNFPARRIAGFESQCLILGLYDARGDVILIQPQKAVDNGAKLG